jgi:signal transduction histidine kinase
MKIRTKLIVIISLLALPLAANLAVLAYLVVTVNRSVQSIQQVAVRQQAVTLRMRAQLRDAEAALYRYQIEGEQGFADQFEENLDAFQAEVERFRQIATTDAERAWADALARDHADATLLGRQLIALRDAQAEDLRQLDDLQSSAVSLLTEIRLGATRPAVQNLVSQLLGDVRELSLAVTGYLATPNTADHVRFTEAALALRFHAQQLADLTAADPGPDSSANAARELVDVLDSLQKKGAQLINGRDQQQTRFAQFAANLYRAGQQTIVEEIQPYVAANLDAAQRRLASVLTGALTWSMVIAIATTGLALAIALPLLRQITASIHDLQLGADRVASGDLSRPVAVAGRDELHQLGEAFNAMMAELAARQERLQARIAELEALRQVGLEMTRSLDLSHVLQVIVESALRLVNAAEAHIFLCDESEAGADSPRFGASVWNEDRRTPAARRWRPPRGAGLVITAMHEKSPQVVEHARSHPLYSGPEAQTWGVRAAAAYPVMLGGEALGVFNIALDDRDEFREDELRILELLADQAAVALGNARLYQNIADKEARLNRLLRQLAVVQEEERRLVGLDLHDGLTQILLSANMHLNVLSAQTDILDEGAISELAMVRRRLQEAIDEVRRVVSELRPTEIEDFGLVDGLRHYVTGVGQDAGWTVEFAADLDGRRLTPAVETAIFRIVQEALTNARKYADASRVRVSLTACGDRLSIVIQDDGRGFAPERLGARGTRLGLVGMEERAQLLGGSLQIHSIPGEGVTVRADIPLDASAQPESVIVS